MLRASLALKGDQEVVTTGSSLLFLLKYILFRKISF